MSRRTAQALATLLELPASEVMYPDAPRPARGGDDVLSDVQWVRLAAVRPSPHQTRLVHDAAAVEALAADIAADRLLHYPVVRNTAVGTEAGDVTECTLVSGHRRVEALRVIEARGTVHPDLRRDPVTGEVSIPVRMMACDDGTAHRRTIAENLIRESLSPWEHAVALAVFAREADVTGELPSLRKLERALGVPRSTLEPLVRIGRALTAPVLAAAGLLARDRADVRDAEAAPLVALTQTVLDRVARVEGEMARAEALRAALGRPLLETTSEVSGDTRLVSPEHRLSVSYAPTRRPGFSMNITTPLEELPPRRAVRHALGLADALRRVLVAAGPQLRAAERDVLRSAVRASSELLKSQ